MWKFARVRNGPTIHGFAIRVVASWGSGGIRDSRTARGTDACHAMVAHRGPMRYIVLFRFSTSKKRTKGLEALALGAHAYDD